MILEHGVLTRCYVKSIVLKLAALAAARDQQITDINQ